MPEHEDTARTQIAPGPETPEGALDLLVVGAGVSGLTVAREVLRRKPSWRVLVLENNIDICELG